MYDSALYPKAVYVGEKDIQLIYDLLRSATPACLTITR